MTLRIYKPKNSEVSFWNCSKCKKPHQWGNAYAAAHWDIELIHTCECGARHVRLKDTITPEK